MTAFGPFSSVAVMQQFGSDGSNSGRAASIAKSTWMTRRRHYVCIAAIETMLIFANGLEQSSLVPRSFESTPVHSIGAVVGYAR
jgi:hypothetical protein